MTWEDLALYIHVNSHEGFLDACKGVPIEHIRECERGLGIVFPPMYVDFLVAMGVDACGYRPMGAKHEHDFHVLLDRLDEPKCPDRRYFRIGYQVEDLDDPLAPSIMEPYLDLALAADGDTPLVEIPGDIPFRREHVCGLDRTLAEYLAWTATLYFGLSRTFRMSLMADGELAAEPLRMRDQALEVLGRLGLKIEIQPSPFFVCVGNLEILARLQVREVWPHGLSITLAGYDEPQVRRTARRLLDAVPGLVETWMSDDWDTRTW